MKRFNDYTDAELLTLTNEIINDAIRIEAISQGVQPPITLSEALRTSEWKGYQLPAEHSCVWELCTNENGYVSVSQSGLGYLSEDQAIAAMNGVISIDRPYSSKTPKLKSCEVSIQKVFIGVSPQESKAAKFDEFSQDNTKFDEIKDACMARWSKARQDDYNKRVNAEKKAEYLRLSGNDEEIAKGFWAKVEKTEWPQ